jgi:hypothetical protein
MARQGSSSTSFSAAAVVLLRTDIGWVFPVVVDIHKSALKS